MEMDMVDDNLEQGNMVATKLLYRDWVVSYCDSDKEGFSGARTEYSITETSEKKAFEEVDREPNTIQRRRLVSVLTVTEHEEVIDKARRKRVGLEKTNKMLGYVFCSRGWDLRHHKVGILERIFGQREGVRG